MPKRIIKINLRGRDSPAYASPENEYLSLVSNEDIPVYSREMRTVLEEAIQSVEEDSQLIPNPCESVVALDPFGLVSAGRLA